jgi:hypothetical protein
MTTPLEIRIFRYKEPERVAARAAGERRYFTGRTCSYGHIAERVVANRECVECAKEKAKRSYVKDIKKSRTYQRNFARSWRRENPDRFKMILVRAKAKRYGLSLDEFFRLLDQQNHTCAACPKELKADRYTHIDHCHETGKVRGILCHSCNITLGLVKNNPDILRSIAKYIDASKGTTP